MGSALKLFAERGFDGTPVSAIARDSGVSQGAFYWYFETKDHVLVALIERAVGEGEATAARIIGLPLSGREKVIAGFRELQKVLRRGRHLWNVVHARTLDSDVVEQAHAASHEFMVKFFLMLIEEGRTDGSISISGPPGLVARILVAMADYAFSDPSTRNDPAVLKTVCRLVEMALNNE